MSKPQFPFIVDPAYFNQFLRIQMGMMNLSAAELAAKLDVTIRMVYLLLSGDAPPSEKVWTALGLTMMYAMDYPEGSILTIPNGIFATESFPIYLHGWRNKETVEDLAKRLGVSKQFVYTLLTGKSKPSDKILKIVGLRRILAMPEAEFQKLAEVGNVNL